jgi:hypothetical protein
MAPASPFPKRQAPLPESLSGRHCPTALPFICSEKILRCFLPHLSIYIACGVPKTIYQLFHKVRNNHYNHPTISA